jgi:hypothetical protein
MFLTWADDADVQREIMDIKTKEDIFHFYEGKHAMLVVDQLNGLQEKDKDPDNARKQEVWDLIEKLRFGRKAVLSASANNLTYIRRQQQQIDETTMFVYGGLTPVSHKPTKKKRLF